MDFNKMKATVKGKTQTGRNFEVEIHFEMIPPKENDRYYGTGYYMAVEMPSSEHLVDVRYEGTTDVEILADRFIKNQYGENAREVIKCFD